MLLETNDRSVYQRKIGAASLAYLNSIAGAVRIVECRSLPLCLAGARDFDVALDRICPEPKRSWGLLI